jgi:hypothetical protein
LADESKVFVDLVEHRLRDLDRPIHVFQETAPFPPPVPGCLPGQIADTADVVRRPPGRARSGRQRHWTEPGWSP